MTYWSRKAFLIPCACIAISQSLSSGSAAQSDEQSFESFGALPRASSTAFSYPAGAALAPEAPGAFPDVRFVEPRTSDPLWDDGPDDKKEEARSPWMFSLEAVTHVPVDVGAQVLLETPFGMRVSGGFGWIPQAYIDLVANAAVETGAVDGRTGGAVRDSFTGGTVLRTQLGLRPFGGFYVDGGYALVKLRGNILVDELASSLNVGAIPFVPETAGVNLRSTLHMWTIDIGWQTQIAERVLGFSAGVMGTIAASSAAEADFDVPDIAAIDPIVTEATNTAEERIKRYGFIPTLTARLGYDLF